MIAALAARSATSQPNTCDMITNETFSAENVPTVSNMTARPHTAVAIRRFLIKAHAGPRAHNTGMHGHRGDRKQRADERRNTTAPATMIGSPGIFELIESDLHTA